MKRICRSVAKERLMQTVLPLLAAMLLGACGGGGGSAAPSSSVGSPTVPGNNPPPTPTPTPTPPPIGSGNCGIGEASTTFVSDAGFGIGDSGADGTAGDGVPIAGAHVTVTDASGATAITTTDSGGCYRTKITGFVSPLIVKVVKANGDVYHSLTTQPVLPGSFQTINLSGLTDKIASDVAKAGGGNGSAQLKPQHIENNLSVISESITEIKAMLATVIEKAGLDATTFDPLNTPFVTNRAGYDNVLDNTVVTKVPNGETRIAPAPVYVPPVEVLGEAAVSSMTASQDVAGESINGSYVISGQSPSTVRVHAGSSAYGTYACYRDMPAATGLFRFGFNGDWVAENGLSCAALLPAAFGKSYVYFKFEVRDAANRLVNGGAPIVMPAALYSGASNLLSVTNLTAKQYLAGQPLWGSFIFTAGSVTTTMLRVHAAASAIGPYACYVDIPNTTTGSKVFFFMNSNYAVWLPENGLTCAALLPVGNATSNIYFKVEARDDMNHLANGGAPPTTPPIPYVGAGAAPTITASTGTQSGPGQPLQVSFNLSASNAIQRVVVWVNSKPGDPLQCNISLSPTVGVKSFRFPDDFLAVGSNCNFFAPAGALTKVEDFYVEASDVAGKRTSQSFSFSYTPDGTKSGVDGLTAAQSAKGQAINGSFMVSGAQPTSLSVTAFGSLGGMMSNCQLFFSTSVGMKTFSFDGTGWGGGCASLLPAVTGTSATIYFVVHAVDAAGKTIIATNTSYLPYVAVGYTK